MKRVFVFCIGGTGVRVMKSLLMLLASGADTNNFEVIPIVVDPHRDLEEYANLRQRIECYQKIYNYSLKKASGTDNHLDGFFQTTVTLLEDLGDLQNDQFESIADSRSFRDYLGVNNIPQDSLSQYFIQTLYSEQSLEASLSVGFKGNPNVGTVVLNDQVERSDWWGTFKREFKKEHDRVFIISSIFGGTGASGYPLIEKKIREFDKDIPMGAISVFPYFSLLDPTTTQSSIDSANFMTKTKAALAYYEATVKSDYFYYIGDASYRGQYENNEEKQKNHAHFIELVAATAVLDFLKREPQDTIQYMSRCIADDKDSLNRESLGDGYANLVKHIADMYLLMCMLRTIKDEKYFPLRIKRKINNSLFSSDAVMCLNNFFNDFKHWYKELSNNKRAFNPIQMEEDNTLIEGWVNGKNNIEFDISYYLQMMIRKSESDDAEKHNNAFRHLLDLSYQAINCFTKKLTDK